jgi:septal ring factor EnvC (AmiA/AmiB activator)
MRNDKAKNDSQPEKRRTITINRSAATINELDVFAKRNNCKSTPDFLLLCVAAFQSAVDQETSAAIGQMNRQLNALIRKAMADEASSEELTTALHRFSSELRRLPVRLREKH